MTFLQYLSWADAEHGWFSNHSRIFCCRDLCRSQNCQGRVHRKTAVRHKSWKSVPKPAEKHGAQHRKISDRKTCVWIKHKNSVQFPKIFEFWTKIANFGSRKKVFPVTAPFVVPATQPGNLKPGDEQSEPNPVTTLEILCGFYRNKTKQILGFWF